MNNNAPFSTNLSGPADSGFAGTLKNIQLNDLIQMCCLSASSLCMRVSKGGRYGTIFIIDGEIVHAACEEMAGEEAFYRILGWQTGSFESVEVTGTPPRTIDKSYQYLIMEAARRVDEKRLLQEEASDAVEASLEAETVDHRPRVLIVDDSSMMRKILSGILDDSGQVQVVGMAGNGREAIQLVNELSPDLVTLDINMPVMDGTSTIKHIMIRKPCPVVIMSNAGDGAAKTIFNFLELGAVDFINKPTKNHDIILQREKIVQRLKVAATAKANNFRIPRLPNAALRKQPAVQPADRPCRCLVVVVSGPGGHPEQMSLLAEMVPVLGEIQGAVVVLPGLPPVLGSPLARYLNQRCGFPAHFIGGEMILNAGQCYVGGSGKPHTAKATDQGPCVTVGPVAEGDDPIAGFLRSAALVFREQLAVVLLSGAELRNHDGVKAVRSAGGRIILRERTSTLVAKPLDQIAAAGLADAEIDPADLVATVLSGFAP